MQIMLGLLLKKSYEPFLVTIVAAESFWQIATLYELYLAWSILHPVL